jgi:phenylacetate-coenzyme A ligase PaaK-like adenylate-forming protein
MQVIEGRVKSLTLQEQLPGVQLHPEQVQEVIPQPPIMSLLMLKS